MTNSGALVAGTRTYLVNWRVQASFNRGDEVQSKVTRNDQPYICMISGIVGPRVTLRRPQVRREAVPLVTIESGCSEPGCGPTSSLDGIEDGKLEKV